MPVKKQQHATSRATDADRLIGKRVRIARLTAKLSQTELGRHLGVTFQQIQKYENGKNRIAVGRLEQIAEACRCPIGALFAKDVHNGHTDIFANRNVIALVQPFNTIANDAVQRAIIGLVKTIAETHAT
jgi:transcriptional regulator with XRE-family HTH domain